MSDFETGYVPGLFDGKIKVRDATREGYGPWQVWFEGGRPERIASEKVFRTREAAEAQAAMWWPECAVPKR